jgi:hypothetical protein
MISFESVANIIIVIIFLGFWLVSFVILYHLSRFGVGVLPKKLSALFLVGALALFGWSIVAFTGLNLGTIKL